MMFKEKELHNNNFEIARFMRIAIPCSIGLGLSLGYPFIATTARWNVHYNPEDVKSNRNTNRNRHTSYWQVFKHAWSTKGFFRGLFKGK